MRTSGDAGLASSVCPRKGELWGRPGPSREPHHLQVAVPRPLVRQLLDSQDGRMEAGLDALLVVLARIRMVGKDNMSRFRSARSSRRQAGENRPYPNEMSGSTLPENNRAADVRLAQTIRTVWSDDLGQL
jgi:hypothetical protein